MSQATVQRILAIEAEATRVRDEAKAQAAQMVGDFEREAAATRERVLRDARAEALQTKQEGRSTADSRRAEIMEAAKTEAAEMEHQAAERLEDAVQYVLDQITGRA